MTDTEYKIYMELKGKAKEELTRTEKNILKIIGKYKFTNFDEVF